MAPDQTSTTMRALRQRSDSGPRDLELVRVPVPRPGPGDVLVRVVAAGVNFADVMQTHGTYGGGPAAPYVAGFEAAGEIVGTGPDVRPDLPGGLVVGTGAGAFAEFVVMRAGDVLPVPRAWTAEQALGMVLNWGTALVAVGSVGAAGCGDTVVVPSAAGGVGQAAVRIARHRGADVIALAASGKHDVVRALGVTTVVDAARDDLVDLVRDRTGGGADVVLESSGGGSFVRSLRMARPVTGRVVVYGTAGGLASVTNHDLVFTYRVQLTGVHIGALAAHEPRLFAALHTELLDLVAAGVYPPGDPRVFDLADGPAVLAGLGGGRSVGKLALRP